MKNYYILEGNMYVIEDEIYKLFENQHITPTKSELLKVEELIKNTNKDIFSSPRLNEIAKKNNELYKIDVLPDILGRMEKFIGVLGEEYIASFYKNLETVKFKFDVPMKSDESISHYTGGSYDPRDNVIRICPHTIYLLKKIAKEENVDFNVIWNTTLAHELFHMASCDNKLYNKTGYVYQGLNKMNLNKKISRIEHLKSTISIPFDEGITQLFACTIYRDEIGEDNFNLFNYGWLIHARVMSQLGLMIEQDEIKKAYFGHSGTRFIKDKLLQINNHKHLYNSLYFLLLSFYMADLADDKLDNKQRHIYETRVQHILLQYESEYINTIDNIEEKNSFIKSIYDFFIGYLEEPEKLNVSDEDIDLMQENLNILNGLKEKQKTYKK